MYDCLLGDFECCPTAKGMWDQLKIMFDQTSATRLNTLRLYWMDYKFNSNQTVTEHLRTMSGIVWDLEVAGHDVPEKEQVLNVIQSVSDTEHWWTFLSLWCITRT